MVRRVRRPKEHEALMETLANEEGSVFQTYKDAMVFAAALGFNHGKRQKIEKTGQQIDYNIFTRHGDQEAMFALLALADNQSLDLLSDDRTEDRLTVFEEYAAAGLDIIKGRLAKGKAPLDTLLALVGEAAATPDEGADDELDEVRRAIGA